MNARHLLLAISTFISLQCAPQAIFWDLGDTLIETKKLHVAKQIGLGDFIGYTLFDWHNPARLESHLFSFLGSLKPHERSLEHVPTNNGQPMPELMCQWQEGKISPAELSDISRQAIAEHDRHNRFISPRHKRLLENTLSFMFDPIKLGSSFKIIKDAARLLDEVARYTNKDGSKHTLFIISNFESLAFDTFAKTDAGKQLLSYFDPVRIIISGKIGKVKPHPDIFTHVLTAYQLTPSDCILIDNEKANIDSARRLGIRGILFDPRKTGFMRKKFKKHGLIY